MYTKEELTAAIKNEFRIIKHLATKIPADTEGYKPTENQRTTLELLQYLSYIFIGVTKTIAHNDSSVYGPYVERSQTTTVENFIERMEEQETELVQTIDSFSEADLQTIINLYNQGDKTKAAYLVQCLLGWSAAYKTQLFLYIKASGNSALNTANLWGGIDMPAK